MKPSSDTLAAADSGNRMRLLYRYLGDWRSLFPGGTAGILQLMYPPLGAAIAAQSDFFGNPFGRVYRSIPQIWATVLQAGGAERAIKIRDLHRTINGTDGSGQSYHALDPKTWWWAHATFTWEVFESIRLFHVGGLRRVDVDRLYAETVEWYHLYGVSYRDIPATYPEFCTRFEQFCRDDLQMTPAARHTLDLALAGDWRAPLVRDTFRNPVIRNAGRIVVTGTLPATVRARFDIPWPESDRRRFERICWLGRWGFALVPHFANWQGMKFAMRYVGASTRPERFVPSHVAHQPSSPPRAR